MKPKDNNSEEGKKSREDLALETFSELMIEKVKSIQQDWKKPWFTQAMASAPRNLSFREYNGSNSLMLSLKAEKEGYELPIWATFDRVVSLNFSKGSDGKSKPVLGKDGKPLPHVGVNKGEKSFPVFLTVFKCVDPRTKESIPYTKFRELNEEERKRFNVYPRQQVYNVFNISQTNIKEARPELYAKLEAKCNPQMPERGEGKEYSFAPMEKMIKDNLWICPIKPTYGDDAYFSISMNEIVIPEKSQFLEGEAFYSNLFHEMAHSTGAENVLNRLKPSSFSSSSYAREELVAELGAAVIASRYGMEKGLKNDSAAYLKSWLDSMHESPDFLKTVLLDVKRSTNIISQHIDGIQMALDENREITKEQLFPQRTKQPVIDEKAAEKAAVANRVKELETPGQEESVKQEQTEQQAAKQVVTHGRGR